MHVEHAVSDEAAGQSVYVYEIPVRLWHWINVAALAVLVPTGYLIGIPILPTPSGEAIDHFWFGYVRFAHFAAGYIFAVGLAGRIYWAFAGNRHAHQIFFLPIRDLRWWREVRLQTRWVLLLAPQPKRYLGHNPLAQLAILVGFVLPALLMAFTGFALYSEGKGLGRWHDRVFGWVIPLLGGSQALHTWHHLVMWVLITFSILHIYMVVREDSMSRQTILDSMLSGWRTFRR